MAIFLILDVDVKMDGMELIAHDEQSIVSSRARMSCVEDMELVYIQMTQMDIDVFVIKDGLVMAPLRLAIKISMNAKVQLHTVQWIQKFYVLIYPALIHGN